MRGISVVLLLGVVASAAPWTRTLGGGFEVLSNAGDRTTRAILDRMLAAEAVFRDAPEAPRSMPPVRVIIFGSGRDYRPFRLASDVEGFFQSAPDRLWIAVHAGAQEPGRVAVHEYVHALLSRSPVRLPAWLEEGLPELYSTMSPARGGVSVGDPIPSRLKALDGARLLTAAELAHSDRQPSALFYAESWALAHMLSLGPDYRGRLAGFIDALASGAPPASAFREAFGKSLDDAIRDLRSYTIRPAVIETGSLRPLEASATVPITEPESMAIRAELLSLMRREPQAAALYGELAHRYPETPEAKTGQALLAMRRGEMDRARDLLRDAAQSGGVTASTWFEYAMMLNDARAPDAEIDAALSKVVELSPDHAEAHLLLGIHAGRAGRWDDSERELRRAAALLPRESKIWYELAWALKNAGRVEAARDAARKAAQLSTTNEEEARARTLLDSLEN